MRLCLLQGGDAGPPLTLQQLLRRGDPGVLVRASFQALAADMVASIADEPAAVPPPAPVSAANSSGVRRLCGLVRVRLRVERRALGGSPYGL